MDVCGVNCGFSGDDNFVVGCYLVFCRGVCIGDVFDSMRFGVSIFIMGI